MYSSRVVVDLDAIRNNVRLMLKHTGVQIMAMVKANGYGHGAIPAARAAIEAGATWCAVANMEEGLELRQAQIDCPILLLGYVSPDRYEQAIANRFSLTVWDTEQVAAAAQAAALVGEPAHLHLKVDTGMSRLGVEIEDAPFLAGRIAETAGIVFEGLSTHFARADEADTHSADDQEHKLHQVLATLADNGIRPQLVHAANSAASLVRPGSRFDLVRVGIAMYGLAPSPTCPLPDKFQPALAWQTVLSHVKWLPAGRGISYGHIYTTSRRERIGTIPVGYADGLRRLVGNQVLVNGRRVPVIGQVCMDQSMIQLDDIPQAKTGDEVVLIGRQGAAQITADDVAQAWGTINYEVLCAIGPRVPRVYKNQ